MNPTQLKPETEAMTSFHRAGVQPSKRDVSFLNVTASRFFGFSRQHEPEKMIELRWNRLDKIKKPPGRDDSARLADIVADLQRTERERDWLLEGARNERFHSLTCLPRTVTKILHISTPSHRVVYPSEGTDANTVLAALRPSLATLSIRRNLVILRRLLASPSVWFDADLATWPEWSTRTGNLVLLVVSAACHIGALRFSGGMWAVTALGRTLAARWDSRDPLSVTTESWNEAMAGDFVRATHWAWDIAISEPYRSLFCRLMEPALGWDHEDLPTPVEHFRSNEQYQRWCALTCVASAAALGAIWYTGARWEPQMLGLYLSCHPDSPLRRL